MAEVANDRPEAFSNLVYSLNITNESTSNKVAEIIKMVGWDLISGDPDFQTVNKFKGQYNEMIAAAKRIGDGSAEHSINELDSDSVVGYLVGLGRVYGVADVGASVENAVDLGAEKGHLPRKDSGYKHPFRR